jgi:hypothetical protein
VYTILLLAEETLHDHDVKRLAALHADDDLAVHVLVPADAEHNRLIEALDEVALGKLGDTHDNPSPEQAEHDAMHAVNASVGLFTAAGIDAKGSITGADPVPAAIKAAEQYEADEVVVVTRPHPVEDGLHRDWASRLRDKLELPVLHVISGTDRVIR